MSGVDKIKVTRVSDGHTFVTSADYYNFYASRPEEFSVERITSGGEASFHIANPLSGPSVFPAEEEAAPASGDEEAESAQVHVQPRRRGRPRKTDTPPAEEA